MMWSPAGRRFSPLGCAWRFECAVDSMMNFHVWLHAFVTVAHVMGHDTQSLLQGRVPSALLDSQVDPASFEISGHMVSKRQQDYDALTQDGIWDLLSYASLSEEAFTKFCHFALDF